MNKKKLFIIILIILLVIIIFITSFIIINKIDNKTKINNNNVTMTTIDISEETTTTTEETTNTIENTTLSSTTTTKSTKEVTSKITKETTKNTTSTITKTLNCPSGYTLINNICSITVNANYVCPTDTHETSSDECVSFNGSIPSENEECPPGYKAILMISFGSPDRYDCLPLYKKIYKCDDGYTLHDTNKCTKTVNPQ